MIWYPWHVVLYSTGPTGYGSSKIYFNREIFQNLNRRWDFQIVVFWSFSLQICLGHLKSPVTGPDGPPISKSKRHRIHLYSSNKHHALLLVRKFWHLKVEKKLATHMLQISTFGPYFALPSNSGAAYAGLPHCVTQNSCIELLPSGLCATRTELLNPKSTDIHLENSWNTQFFINSEVGFAYVMAITTVRHTVAKKTTEQNKQKQDSLPLKFQGKPTTAPFLFLLCKGWGCPVWSWLGALLPSQSFLAGVFCESPSTWSFPLEREPPCSVHHGMGIPLWTDRPD